MERQRDRQVNTTYSANNSAIKITAEIWKKLLWHGGVKKKQIQRGDVLEEYKYNLVGVKEQLNWLRKGIWTVVHD